LVGPGRYGDVNGDGRFDDPGDEAAELQVPGCECMLKIDKPLTLESTHGAGATVLDAVGMPVDVVRIFTDHVVFGAKGKGFTLTRGRNGLAILSNEEVRVRGNRSIGNAERGFLIGNAERIFAPFPSRIKVSDNVADGNGLDGFQLFGRSANDIEFVDNVATGNGRNGFLTSDIVDGRLVNNFAGGNAEAGFFFATGAGVLAKNVAGYNRGDGFVLAPTGVLTLEHNTASANDGAGFSAAFPPFVATEALLRGNAALGNRLGGIRTASSRLLVEQSNLFGNIGGNCGLINASGGRISVPNNFWGASDGPGPDPADAVCDVGTSATTSSPFADRAFNIPVTAGR
jgi:hypothetical protein